MAADCTQVSEDLDINEATEIRWIPLDEAVDLIRRGDIVGAASVVDRSAWARRAER
jgi:hypothetical protein